MKESIPPMPSAAPGRAPQSRPPEPEEPSVSPLELLQFAARSARQHRLSCIIVGVCIAVVGVAGVAAIPSVYESQAKLFVTQQNALTASLTSGRREETRDALRGVSETVMKRDNLLQIVRGAKLAESWPSTRTWPLALKDRLMAAMLGPPSQQAKERALVELLEGAMSVTQEDGTSIRFKIWWRNAVAAHDVIDLAIKNFLAARSAEESAAIQRGITILEEQLKRADAQIEPAMKNVSAVVAKVRGQQPAQPSAPKQPTDKPSAPRPSLSQQQEAAARLHSTEELTGKLQEIRRAQREVMEPWQRRLADLRFRLTEMRAQYGEEHPLIRTQEAKIEAASSEPPELGMLRREEEIVMTDMRAIGVDVKQVSRRSYGGGTGGTTASAGSDGPLSLRSLLEDRDEDPEVSAARLQLDTALRKSKDLNERLDDARMELVTSQEGVKYRYAVVEAPEIPNKPFKPKRGILYAAAILAALALGFLTGTLRELLRGRLVEAWQVRRLGLDVLAEVDFTDLTPKAPK